MISSRMPEKKKRPSAKTPPESQSETSSESKPLPIDDKPAVSAESTSRKQRAPKSASKPAAPKTARAPKRTPESSAGLSIFMVASEAHPYAKTGGLAGVVAALPDALGRLGHHVTLVLPRYRGVDVTGARSQVTVVPVGHHPQKVAFHTREERRGVTVVFVDVPELFDRPGLYNVDGVDYPDNGWRFAVFCRAALEYARIRGERPSIIHAHDWQAGLVPVYQKMHFSPDPTIGGVPAIFTIHNLAFQGLFPTGMLPALGFGPELLDIQALEFWGRISYLKGGINFSERLTTVSPTYAREIMTPEFGFGFDGVLRRRADALTGIVNGIDVERWNPEKDEFIGAAYSRQDLSGKLAARRVLLETAGLSDDQGSRPV